MKLLPRLILACTLFATCTVAGAQTFNAAADQDRRARNREEALAKYRAAAQDRPAARSSAAQDRSPTRSSAAAERRDSAGGPTLGDRTRNATKSVRNFTHRQAEKARNFSERQDRRWGNRNSANQPPNRNKTRGTPD
jgi:hypothetical protein